MPAMTVLATMTAAMSSTGSLISTGQAVVASPQSPMWQTVFSAVRDGIVTVAAVVGAYVAIKGLDAWRSQLRGQSEYSLSKRILTLLQKYRDALRATRHPWMEYSLPEESDGESLSREQRQYRGVQKAYEERWERVQNARAELYPELLEARVLWGTTIDEALAPLWNLERKLLFAIRDHLKVSNPDVSRYEKEYLETPEQRDRLTRDLYDTLSDDDQFASETDKVIDAVSSILGPHLS